MSDDWRRQAACRGKDPDLWHPLVMIEDRHRVMQAKAVCMTCPVMADCREHAIRNEPDGIWGATTPAERDEIRTGRGWATYRQRVMIR